jgi:Asp-tRNA(Asn)/Glu-tRNA(Gln) amidotransferase A subunit family amidase
LTAQTDLAQLSAVDAAAQLRAGALGAREYAQALLERVHQREPEVQAWTHLDEQQLLSQADAADSARAAGAAPGALHGIPVGVKDIIDTRDMPTENGTVLHQGRQPREDAMVVSRVRAAGGLIMGKTVTTELATYAPGKTRNPHNASHTPGGSSSGSAAAVAAGMVPLAIGTQTNGSVIRPASFCGVVGFKPTATWIPRTGVLQQSPVFDQIGVFARSVDDAALLVQCISGRNLSNVSAPATDAPPGFGFARTPMWERMAPDAQAAFTDFVKTLGQAIADAQLPSGADSVYDLHRTLMEADIANSFHAEYERGRDRLSQSLRSQIERGSAVTSDDYQRALHRRDEIADAFDGMFESFDAILTPAALGTAPNGLDSTGDPIMCTLWTFTGQPAITIPLLKGTNGLPIGVQLVGRRDGDVELLRTARWLSRFAGLWQ